MMQLIRSGEKNVFAASMDRIEYFNANNSLQIEVLQERMFLIPIVLFVRKESCLIDVFDEELRRFSASGLITHWIRNQFKTHRKYWRENVDGFSAYDEDDDGHGWAGRFDLMQLLCAFQILVTLHVFCAMVLALEVASQRFVIIKKIVDFFTY